MSGIFSAGGAGNVGVSGFYPVTINDSLRFEDGSSAYLNRTPASAGNLTTWTWSGWVKRGNLINGTLFSGGSASAITTNWIAFIDDSLAFSVADGTYYLQSTAVYRDPSAFYHVVAVYDSGNSTSSNRMKLYVNGVQITSFSASIYPTQNYAGYINGANGNYLGVRASYGDLYFDGYLSDIYFIDGQALDPTSFGEEKDGTWIPKSYSGSYGTNGFNLEFNGNSNDTSGNGNNWTANNISAHDYVPDTPTNNFAVLNRNLPDSHFNTDQLSEGNLFYNEGEAPNDGDGRPTATFSVTSGKWYWEVQVPSQQNSRAIRFTRTDNIGKGNVTLHGSGFTSANSVVGIDLTDDTIDQVDKAGTHTQHASSLTGMANNDIFGFSVDLDGGTFQMYRNGSAYGSSYNLDDLADWQTNGMTPTASGDTYMAYRFNFGQDSTFSWRNDRLAATKMTTAWVTLQVSCHRLGGILRCVPQTFQPLRLWMGLSISIRCLFTGDDSADRAITVGFQPDLTWQKGRNIAGNHVLIDQVRGATKVLSSDTTAAEDTVDSGNGIVATSTGIEVSETGDWSSINRSGRTIAAWNWKAGGTAVSNTDGSITSQRVCEC
jgi:hypothetical protein